MIYVALVLGCFLLFKGGDWLLDGMLGVGQKLELPKAIVGLVLVSLGTSAPELFVSVGSALQDHGGMAAGNVVGSNIINISVVLGLTLCMVTLSVERVLQHQLIAVIVISLLAVWAMSDGQITRFEGLCLMTFMAVSLLVALKTHSNTANDLTRDDATDSPIQNTRRSVFLTLGGIVTLLVGAESLIWGGLALAEKLNLSETVVALTVTALGTSLPEIAASIVAVARRETSLALGNVVGSNLLNLGLVLGVSAAIAPLAQVELDALTLVFFVSLAVAVFALSLKPGFLPRWAGFALVSSYFAYVGVIVLT